MAAEKLSKSELDFILEASRFLDNPSLLVKLSHVIGKPIEYAHDNLPESVRNLLSTAVQESLNHALTVAISSIKSDKKSLKELSLVNHRSKKTKWFHTASATASGAVGGFFGPLTLAIELPITTGIILRGISSVAKEWGHDLSDPSIQLQCLYVFTLGSKKSKSDNELESSYVVSRVAFNKLISEASKFIGQQGAKELLQSIKKGTAPILIKFLAKVATVFELKVTEKLIAQAVPFLGSLGGAAVNAAFCEHFVEASRFHFGLLHLEKKFGSDFIQKHYLEMSAKTS